MRPPMLSILFVITSGDIGLVSQRFKLGTQQLQSIGEVFMKHSLIRMGEWGSINQFNQYRIQYWIQCSVSLTNVLKKHEQTWVNINVSFNSIMGEFNVQYTLTRFNTITHIGSSRMVDWCEQNWAIFMVNGTPYNIWHTYGIRHGL